MKMKIVENTGAVGAIIMKKIEDIGIVRIMIIIMMIIIIVMRDTMSKMRIINMEI